MMGLPYGRRPGGSSRPGSYATSAHNGAVDCDYRELANGQHRIKQFVVRAPRVWWSDSTSDANHEHGTVGWRVRIQKNADPNDHPNQWSTVLISGVQKRTAYEDHPGYDNGDKAPFSTRSFSWSFGESSSVRVKTTVYWFRANGSVKGSVDHWYTLYDADFGPNPAIGYCANKYPPQ